MNWKKFEPKTTAYVRLEKKSLSACDGNSNQLSIRLTASQKYNAGTMRWALLSKNLNRLKLSFDWACNIPAVIK